MTRGIFATRAWPRLGAHLGIVLTVAAIWVAPHGHAKAVEIRPRSAGAAVAVAPQPEPKQLLAGARGTSRSLPNAAANPPQVIAGSGTRPGHHLPPPAHAPHPPVPAPAPAPAAPPQGGGWGSDISWPQCDGGYPGAHDVGTVGVTGGRPFTTNPCLGSEYGWAKGSRFAGGAQVYVNLEIDGTSAGPHRCAVDDHPCRAYDYGMLTATDAIGRATAQGVRPDFWWLDVEVGNNWSDDQPDWNARTVQGAIDVFNSRGLAVGIYSSYDQWSQIVPDSYKPGVPTWRAVVGNADMAPSQCATQHSLTGGPVLMVQYDDHGFDQDFVCPEGHRAFARAAAQPH